MTEDHIEGLKNADRLDLLPAASAAEVTFRDLAVNIMRVARSNQGGGEWFRLIDQVFDCARACVAHEEKFGHLPAHEIGNLLNVYRDRMDYSGLDAKEAADQRAEERAINEIVSGALRIAAARLQRNSFEERKGRGQIIDAVRDWKGR